MPELNRGLDALCAEIDSMLLAKNDNSGIGIQAPKGTDTAVDQPCVCNARVICTNATADSEPVHMIKDGERGGFLMCKDMKILIFQENVRLKKLITLLTNIMNIMGKVYFVPG